MIEFEFCYIGWRAKMTQSAIEMIYRFICHHWQEYGMGPTLGEIAAGCYTTKSNLYRYLDRLEHEGRITRYPGRARGIVVLVPCPEPPRDESR